MRKILVWSLAILSSVAAVLLGFAVFPMQPEIYPSWKVTRKDANTVELSGVAAWSSAMPRLMHTKQVGRTVRVSFWQAVLPIQGTSVSVRPRGPPTALSRSPLRNVVIAYEPRRRDNSANLDNVVNF